MEKCIKTAFVSKLLIEAVFVFSDQVIYMLCNQKFDKKGTRDVRSY